MTRVHCQVGKSPPHYLNDRGFTLIELLVVVAIIALLVSILMPSLAKAKMLAKRTMCGANLHNWGLGAAMYCADNQSVLPASWGLGQSPTAIWKSSETPGNPGVRPYSSTQISCDKFAPYVQGFLADAVVPETGAKGMMTGAWVCPEVAGSSDRVKLGWFWSPVPNDEATHWNYAYFARVKDWGSGNGIASRPEDLTDTTLDSTRILMADMWADLGAGYYYNHGGRPMHTATAPNNPAGGIESFAGLNRLYGDGHVTWRSAQSLDVQKLSGNPVGIPNVRYTPYSYYFYY